MGMKNGKYKKPKDITFEGAFKTMLKEMTSGETVYLAFSKRNFRILVFVLAMSIIANIVLVDLLIRAPVMIEKASVPIFVVQFLLSSVAIISGFWLFLRGINIIADE